MKKTLLPLALAIGLVLLALARPWAIGQESPEFGGSDAAAQSLVAELSPGHKAWCESLWTPPGTEVESLLFAVQASLGAGVLGFALGRLSARKPGRTVS